MRHDRTLGVGEVERLLFHMPSVAERATNEWAKVFATDMARRRHWRGWRPSPKQTAVMCAQMAELFSETDEGDFDLFESPLQDSGEVTA